MTQEEYYSKFQNLKNQIENLKDEYIKSLPFKEGDFVRIKYKGKDVETYISQVYMPIYNRSNKRKYIIDEFNNKRTLKCIEKLISHEQTI